MKEKMRPESTKQMRYEKTKPVLAGGREGGREAGRAEASIADAGAKFDGRPLDSLNAELCTIQFACYTQGRRRRRGPDESVQTVRVHVRM